MPEDVETPEVEAGSQTDGAVAGSDSTGEDGGTVADGFGEPFTFGWFDGSQWEIKDRAQLARELGKLNEERRHSRMRHEDLEKERSKLTEREKLMRDQIMRAQEAERRANSSYGLYKPWDELMSQNPQLREEVEKLIDRHKSGGGKQSLAALKKALLAEPEFQEYQQGYEEWKKDKQARASEKAAREANAALKGELADYDEAAVEEFLSELANVPKADGERKLREIAHYALAGMTRAGVLERRATAVPARPGVTSTPGKSTTGPDLDELDEDEREQEIIRRLKAIPDDE